MLNIIRFGAKEMLSSKDYEDHIEEDINNLLEKGEAKTLEQQKRLDEIGESSLRTFTLDTTGTVYLFEGENYRDKQKIAENWIEPPKRERKVANYTVDAMFKDAQKFEPKPPKPPKQPHVVDYHFYPKQLLQLLDMEIYNYQKALNYKVPLKLEAGPNAETIQKQEQAKIDNAVSLTEDQLAQKEEMLAKGFVNWTKRDYNQFVRLNEKFGRDDMKSISE